MIIFDKGRYDEMYSELHKLAYELAPWFDIDKVKSYAVYVWYRPTKEDLKHPNYPGDEFGWNAFDIYADYLQFYRCDWPWRLPNEAIPIIKKIQEKLMEMENYIGGLTNE